MSFIKTPSGIGWFYDFKGEENPVLFIHGWSFNSSVWFKQIDELSRRFKVITLDLPGHGKSEYKRDIDIVLDIKFIIEILKIGKINIVGHSLGGVFALRLAIKYPKLVDKLILVSTTAKFANSIDYNDGLSPEAINKLKGFIGDEYPDILSVFIRWLFSKADRREIELRDDFEKVTKISDWPRKEALAEFLEIIERSDLRKDLGKIVTKTLVVSGTDDPICSVQSAEYLKDNINNSRIELFSGCGHLPFITQYKRFNELILSFLN